MLSSAQDEGHFGRGEGGVQESKGVTHIYCALKCALWRRNLIYAAGPLLGSAGKSWGLNSGIYFSLSVYLTVRR